MKAGSDFGCPKPTHSKQEGKTLERVFPSKYFFRPFDKIELYEKMIS